MDKKYLVKRRQGWYAQVRVKPSLYHLTGKHVLVKTLRTRDLAVANERKWEVVAEMKAYLTSVAKGKESPTGFIANILDAAREINSDLRSGSLDQSTAQDGWDDFQNSFISKKKFSLDNDGYPIAKTKEQEGILEALSLAHGLVYSPNTTRVSEALIDHLDELKSHARKQTVTTREKCVKEFTKWLGGDWDIKRISREKAGQYLTDVLIKQGKAPKTTKTTLSHLVSFFSWSMARGKIDINPFTGLSKTVKETSRGTKDKASTKRREWSPAELSKLFTELDSDSHNWVMAVTALYTGMRSNEIAEVKLEDVHATHIYIPEAKNDNSVRSVPIHKVIAPLIKKLVKTSTDGYLVDGLKRGGEDNKRNHYFVKRFGTKMRAIGIDDNRVVFHSLRKNLSGALEKAGVAVNLAEQIVGHAKQSLTYGLYSDGVPLEMLHDAISKVTFGDIDKLIVDELKDCGEPA